MDEEGGPLFNYLYQNFTGDICQLEEIIKKGVNLNEPLLDCKKSYKKSILNHFARKQKRPLHIAAAFGNKRVVEVLLKNGAEVDIRDREEKTPLHTAAWTGRNDIIQLLVDNGAQVSARDNKGNTPLHRTKCHAVAEILLRNGAAARDKNHENQSALHCIYLVDSFRGLRDITELLIDHGAEVDGQDNNECSPIHYAARHRNSEALSELVRRGANINIQDRQGWYPIHYAVDCWGIITWSNPEVVEILLNHGASPDVQDSSQNTPLHVAASRGNRPGTSVLLRKGVKLDVQNIHGLTALHKAAYFNGCEIITQLLAYGFSLGVKNNKGETPYDMIKNGTFAMNSERLIATHIHLSNLAGLQVCEDVEVDILLSEEKIEKAVEELERIKATDISDQLCLYDVFEHSRRPYYLVYEGVVEEIEAYFQSTDFHDQFPMFADILKGTFNRSKKSRYYWSKRAVRSMMSRTRKECCQVTPDLVWELVCKLLDDEDLTNIVNSEV